MWPGSPSCEDRLKSTEALLLVPEEKTQGAEEARRMSVASREASKKKGSQSSRQQYFSSELKIKLKSQTLIEEDEEQLTIPGRGSDPEVLTVRGKLFYLADILPS
jgi:hypothetical protein